MTSDVQHPTSLARVTFHKPSHFRRSATAAVFVALYAIAGQWCYNTAGEPLEVAKREIEAREAAQNSTAGQNKTSTEDLLQELNEIGAELHHSIDENSLGNSTVSPRPLPSKYLPNAWAGALMFTVGTLNCLFFLLGHWLVWFKAASLYAPASAAKEGYFVHVRTHAHKGKGAMCKLERAKQAPHRLCFEFQRQRFEYISTDDEEIQKKDSDIEGLGAENGYVRLRKSPVDLQISLYHASKGLNDDEIDRGNELFGKNTLVVPTPKFWELYKQQMVSPLVVFQFFTALLWMLDEYWQFVMMQMFMVLMLESTTVFQRIKTFGTLNSMSSKPYKIKAFRNKEWQDISTELLLPGDIISVKASVPKSASTAVVASNGSSATATPAPAKKPAVALDENTGIVPCDCVLLNGDAVVNEATLTGESVPQMKDALKNLPGQEESKLDIDGTHRVHMLFSGTQIIAATGPDQSKAGANSKDPRSSPDGGCICYVVRTGFNSSQGAMMQMIEYSQHQMTDDSKETAYALLVLLFFALIAAGYVLKKGLEKGDRTTHELLIRCVIIITSTVPKQLPMQMALAVNTALIGLMKRGVFCTEPFRVPLAGKVNVCVFDKTGTLTTDQLVPIGMLNWQASRPTTQQKEESFKKGDKVKIEGVVKKPELNSKIAEVLGLEQDDRVNVKVPGFDKDFSLKRTNLVMVASKRTMKVEGLGLSAMTEACPEALMVMVGCHSLVEVAGAGVMGDPIELAALKGVEWRYDSKTTSSLPGNWDATQKAIASLEEQIKKFQQENNKEKKEQAEKDKKAAEERVVEAKERAKKSPLKSVKILHRHHFSSKLQRMSVLAHIDRDASPKGQVCLVKGSPEAIRKLVLADKVPEWYDRSYREMAECGLRVLALAYKWCKGDEAQLKNSEGPPRDWVESDLHFAGFLAFGCKTRGDSGLVLRAIKEADVAIGMLTGDAPLTALHVAKEVSICEDNDESPCLLLEASADNTEVKWVQAIGEIRESQPFSSPGVVELAKKYDLMVTESAMELAAELTNGKLWEEVHAIKVFARMSPQGKARVIRAMQEHSGANVFMCGDGGNDVGALKQADVGMALLSGHGNTNTSDVKPEEAEGNAEDALNSHQKTLAKRSLTSQKAMKEELKVIQAELQAKQKQRMMDEVNALANNGQAGIMSTIGVMRSTMGEFKTEWLARQKEVAAKYGNVYDDNKSMKLLKEEMESEMGQMTIRPGDASVAAPFTCRSPSVANLVDVLRQGRCTLLSALQNQQIMMLECIISAYTLSAMSLEGGRSSDRQMMATGWLLSIAGMAFAFTSPIDKISKIRPLNSLFHPAVFFSMLGQAAIHLGCMVFAIQMATDEMGPAKLKAVVDFHKQQKMIRLGQMCKDGSMPIINGTNTTSTGCPVEPDLSDDWMAWAMSLINTPFLPNLLNTVTWLVETSQMCAVTFVNYKGRPWMKGIMENHALFLSSFGCIVMIACCAWEAVPQVNELLHLAPFPNDGFRFQVMALVFLSLGGTFIWDRICIALFAPDIMKAMMDNAKETTMEDIMQVLRTLGKVLGCLAVYLTGNPLIWVGAFWWYKSQQKKKAEAEAEKERLAAEADLD
mmetsp:Transcript_79550/g.125471  ORF Transcript_79550/g.125471 Transcript_79550/m.125471 type:complete len:1593 (+) Transcript_79550:56-4834(+)|eukprot:CAMPEP_0169096540 /NCGR_PEP_ID=MMETSP1015-20121227/19049_1 /TAXON_ID=342587 /ORGANISM="Karlodinium micrum, Strain CCMP2283" /LENGTH=1592 /DNA_ID=CAMNT_0009157303 /DNA_START=47 /DNA_END=4825 /DNA_ORIENTATION=-